MNKIIDFSKGINDKIDAEFIGEGYLADAENVEYNHSPVLSKRYGVEVFDSELDSQITNLGITASKFWVWYPSNMPTDGAGDYVVVVYGSNKLYVMLKGDRVGDWIPEQIVIENVTYTDDSSPEAFIGSKFLISDGVNKGHYIDVDKDGEIVYGILGIPAPINKIGFSEWGVDNEFVSTSIYDIDTGMKVERGNILQLVYTVEDKYGNESNPSPVSTFTGLQYRFPTETDYAPYQYWWAKTKYNNIAIPEGLDKITEDSLEKYNIYRRDMRYTEGSAEGAIFRKVATIDIVDKDSDTHTDTGEYGLKEPSYEQDIAPVSKFISENSQVKFVANLKLKTTFPFGFKYFTEVKLTNNNNRSYINAPIAIKLPSKDVFGSFYTGWGAFQKMPFWRNHIRIFDQDKTTPLPVVYFNSTNLYYILLPYIPENSVRSIYISYDSGEMVSGSWVWDTEGVSDTWQNAEYGEFTDGEFTDGDDSAEWRQQKVFYPNRVRSADTLICCSNEYHVSDGVRNRANRDNSGDFEGNSRWRFRAGFPFIVVNGTTKYPAHSNSSTNKQNVIDFDFYSGIKFGEVDADNKDGITIYGQIQFDGDLLPETPSQSSYISRYNIHTIISNSKLTVGQDDDDRMYGWSLGLANIDLDGTHKKGVVLIWGDGDKAETHSQYPTSKILFWNLDTEIDDFNNNWFIYFTLKPSTNKALLTIRDEDGIIIEEKEQDIGVFNIDDYAVHEDMQIDVGWNSQQGDIDDNNFYNYHYGGTSDWTDIAFYSHSGTHGRLVYEKEIIPHSNHLQLMNFSPYFPEEFLGFDGVDNQRISFEDPIDNEVKDYKNFIKWSTVNGVNFPDLWERAFREPIKGIIPLRRKTELAVDNRMLIFGRNTLNVFTLTGEPDRWYDSTNNIIEDYKQFGILAENSLGTLNDRIFWFSEVGAMMFDDAPIPISMNKIDIPIDEDIIGFAIPLRNQYAFHSQSTNITYVYHLSSDSWTKFTGLDLSLSRILSGGTDAENKNLFLDSDGKIQSYPSSSQAGITTNIVTRKYPLDNNILRRFRTDFDGQMRVETEIKNRSTTLNQSFDPVERMVFRGLSNGSFGEYIQFTLNGFTKLKKLEYEIQGR